MNNVYIIYRDDLGMVRDEVEGAVVFLEGKAYFVVNDEDKVIPVESIVEIG